MSAATRELVHLIDLSLGTQPSGVINFNYLHTLMHAIVGRLGTMESAQIMTGGGRESSAVIDGGGGEERVTGGESIERAAAGGAGGDGVSGVPDSTSEGRRVEGEGDGAGGAAQAKKEPSPTSTPPPPPPTSELTDSKALSSGRASRVGMQGSADLTHQMPKSFVTAANDLGAMERKLQELESRLNAMDTLPELLERKSSDMGATPIKDRWNFTNLSKRLSAAEDGLEQVK